MKIKLTIPRIIATIYMVGWSIWGIWAIQQDLTTEFFAFLWWVCTLLKLCVAMLELYARFGDDIMESILNWEWTVELPIGGSSKEETDVVKRLMKTEIGSDEEKELLKILRRLE